MHGRSLVKRHVYKEIELRPSISGFDFALLEVRNLCVASRLYVHLYNVQDYSVLYNNDVRSSLCGAWHFVHIWKTLT